MNALRRVEYNREEAKSLRNKNFTITFTFDTTVPTNAKDILFLEGSSCTLTKTFIMYDS
jgi:hypothetical protein